MLSSVIGSCKLQGLWATDDDTLAAKRCSWLLVSPRMLPRRTRLSVHGFEWRVSACAGAPACEFRERCAPNQFTFSCLIPGRASLSGTTEGILRCARFWNKST